MNPLTLDRARLTHAEKPSPARQPALAWRWWPALVCLLLDVLLTLLVFGHLTSIGPSTMAGPRMADQIAQVWWLAWDQFALAHGHSLFFTNWQNYPVGYNFGVNGSMIALGVTFSPITALFGPIVTWNVLLRLAMIGSAFSMTLVLRRWTKWWPAAFLGGVVYGFSGYMLDLGSSYLFLTFVPIPPIIFLLLHEIFARQTWRATELAPCLAFFVAFSTSYFPNCLPVPRFLRPSRAVCTARSTRRRSRQVFPTFDERRSRRSPPVRLPWEFRFSSLSSATRHQRGK